ncbi:HdeA/HdeB family protein [Sphingomonas palmae]|uniref:HdeA/HdeB family protein n=1 Tax=Sphingomonas palmae TaxID=1855283 RepID=A0A1H7J7L5_9SPHN|nr:HdeA/HdeB family chaperone [Sphingomonas palmae]SEK69837.1 HdeA/HdeB family protein [Sphingomonas palmae]
MKKIVLVAAGVTALMGGGVAAAATQMHHAMATPHVTEAVNVPGRMGGDRTVQVFKSGNHLETVMCSDFNTLDESFKPEAIRYAANYGPKGKAHPTMTVSGVERIRPVIVADCTARPGDHFVQAVHTAMYKR